MGDWKIHDVTESLRVGRVIEMIQGAIDEHGDLPIVALFDDGAASEYGYVRGPVVDSEDILLSTVWFDISDDQDPAKHLRASQVIKNLKWLEAASGNKDRIIRAQLAEASFPMGGDIRMVMHEEAWSTPFLVIGVEDPEHGCL